jgi:hypothetical protein
MKGGVRTCAWSFMYLTFFVTRAFAACCMRCICSLTGSTVESCRARMSSRQSRTMDTLRSSPGGGGDTRASFFMGGISVWSMLSMDFTSVAPCPRMHTPPSRSEEGQKRAKRKRADGDRGRLDGC